MTGSADPWATLVVCAAPLAERAHEFAEALIDAGWRVQVAATPSAAAWVDATRVEQVTGLPLRSQHRSPSDPKSGGDPLLIVALPLTFNTVNKLALGIADTYALGVLNEGLASGIPVVAVPMISQKLWPHPALGGHLESLLAAGVRFLDPNTGGPTAGPVEPGTGPEVARAFDLAWLLQYASADRGA